MRLPKNQLTFSKHCVKVTVKLLKQRTYLLNLVAVLSLAVRHDGGSRRARVAAFCEKPTTTYCIYAASLQRSCICVE